MAHFTHTASPLKIASLSIIIFCTLMASCGGGRVDIKNQRPVIVNQTSPSADLAFGSLDPSERTAPLGRAGSLNLDEFLTLWRQYPESRNRLASNIFELSRPDFQWTMLEELLTNEASLRPPLSDLGTWATLLDVISRAHSRQDRELNRQDVPPQESTFGPSWWKLTLSAPRPLGLQALFNSRLTAHAAPFSIELWNRLIPILRRPRIRTLGAGAWLKFFAVLPLELEHSSLWANLLLDDAFWLARTQEMPSEASTLETARANAASRLAQTPL